MMEFLLLRHCSIPLSISILLMVIVPGLSMTIMAGVYPPFIFVSYSENTAAIAGFVKELKIQKRNPLA